MKRPLLNVLLALIFAFAAGCGQGYVKQTEKFAAQVKGLVNPDELQAWATNIIATKGVSDPKKHIEVSLEKVPKSVRAIYPEFPPDVYVIDGVVEIWYGSGFGHWGLYVGPPDLELKSTETHYIVPWKPGIYFWNGPWPHRRTIALHSTPGARSVTCRVQLARRE